MEATRAHSDDIHNRLSMMKQRISSKKSTADILFSQVNITSEKDEKKSLQSVLNHIRSSHEKPDGTIH